MVAFTWNIPSALPYKHSEELANTYEKDWEIEYEWEPLLEGNDVPVSSNINLKYGSLAYSYNYNNFEK